jgi:hypothetical protein
MTTLASLLQALHLGDGAVMVLLEQEGADIWGSPLGPVAEW